MNLDLRNKIAVVTGASAGLGRTIAFSLAHEGAKVAISGRRRDVLEESAKELGRQTQAAIDSTSCKMLRQRQERSGDALAGLKSMLRHNTGNSDFTLSP